MTSPKRLSPRLRRERPRLLALLIPFLRKLITNKAEIPPEEMATATVVPVI